MARGPQEDIDLQLVQEIVFAARGLTLERFTHAETVAGRTPDFRVFKDAELVAYCEVKSPRDDWLEDQLAAAQPLEIVGGPRNDPIFNRIARQIEKAVTQFDAVNGLRLIPNILVFVNHDTMSNINDLMETVTGYFQSESGEREPTIMHIAEGRLGSIKRRVDLYVWIDSRTRRVQGYVFGQEDAQHLQQICALLGLDASKITH
jgi:hypothetical protein